MASFVPDRPGDCPDRMPTGSTYPTTVQTNPTNLTTGYPTIPPCPRPKKSQWRLHCGTNSELGSTLALQMTVVCPTTLWRHLKYRISARKHFKASESFGASRGVSTCVVCGRGRGRGVLRRTNKPCVVNTPKHFELIHFVPQLSNQVIIEN